jgi:AraC-like DNA-binding protein
MTGIVGDEARWSRVRDGLRLVCAHARLTRFSPAHVGRNALPEHRLFLVPSRSARGSRVVDEAARRAWPLPPGTAILLPARRRYRFEFADGFRLVGFHFRLEEPGGVDVLDGIATVAHAADAIAAADAAAEAVGLRTPGAWLVAEGILRQCVGRLLDVPWDRVEAASAAARRWGPALARLADAGAAEADIAGLARALGVTRQHFARGFRADLGCPPRAWHRRQLARRAVERLLADDAPLDAVAGELGFSDAFAFSRFVLSTTGQRPRQWRGGGEARRGT